MDLCHHLRAMGDNILNTMIETKILMMLPSGYVHFASAWEINCGNPTNFIESDNKIAHGRNKSSDTRKWSRECLFIKRKLSKKIYKKDEEGDFKQENFYNCWKHWKRECLTKKQELRKRESKKTEKKEQVKKIMNMEML